MNKNIKSFIMHKKLIATSRKIKVGAELIS